MSLALVLDVWDSARGGLEAYADVLCRALLERRVDVTIVCGVASAAPPGARVIKTGSAGLAFCRDADDVVRREDLGRVCAFRHPGRHADVFLPLGGLLVSSLAARRASEPLLLSAPRRLARALSPKTRGFLAREAEFFASEGLVLASSPLVRDEIAHRFPRFPGRVEVAGLPVDDARFRLPLNGERDQLRRSQLSLRDEPCLLWIGNDPVRKGLNVARRVLRRLRQRKLDARLVLVGHGTNRYDGSEPGIVGLGFTDTVPVLLRAVDVLLAPSLEDNLSFSVLEALATGCPVVTTERNGAADWITDRDCGRVVGDPRDVSALDAATLALLERGMLDDEQRQRRRAAVESCFRASHLDRVCATLSSHTRSNAPRTHPG